MSFEELQKVWVTQGPAKYPAFDQNLLMQRLKAESAEFDQKMARRDRREIYAGLFIIVVYSLQWWMSPGVAWAHALSIALILCVTAIFWVVNRRIAAQRSLVGGSVSEQFEWSILQVRMQIRLLQTVAWWYLAPLAVAVFLHSYARHGTLGRSDWVMACAMLAFFAFLYWLNQRAVALSLQPRLDKLLALQSEWRETARDANEPS